MPNAVGKIHVTVISYFAFARQNKKMMDGMNRKSDSSIIPYGLDTHYVYHIPFQKDSLGIHGAEHGKTNPRCLFDCIQP